jgi:hypothetical protein
MKTLNNYLNFLFEVTIPELQKILNTGRLSGLYVVEPHASWIYEGRKTLILKKKNYDSFIGKKLILCGSKAYGIIVLATSTRIDEKQFRKLRDKHLVQDREVTKWWKTYDLISYPFTFFPFKELVDYYHPTGVQTIIKIVKMKKKPELKK